MPDFYMYGHREGATCTFTRIKATTIKKAHMLGRELAQNNGIHNLVVCDEAMRHIIEGQPSLFDLMATTYTNSKGA